MSNFWQPVEMKEKICKMHTTLLHIQREIGETRTSRLICWRREGKLLYIHIPIHTYIHTYKLFWMLQQMSNTFSTLTILIYASTCYFWLVRNEITFYQLFFFFKSHVHEFWHQEHSEAERKTTKLSLNLRKSSYFS